MPNNPISDAALAELDRLHAAALFQYGVRRDESAWYSLGDHTTGPHIQGDIYADKETLTRLATVWNAYPALRQRLLDAESRLAEAERERDELRAKNAAKEDLIREWARYVHTPTGERDTTVAERFWKDIEARFFGGEFDSLRWLTDRDARMKREGAAEWLEKFVAIAAGLSTPVTLRILQAEANRLRDGKNV